MSKPSDEIVSLMCQHIDGLDHLKTSELRSFAEAIIKRESDRLEEVRRVWESYDEQNKADFCHEYRKMGVAISNLASTMGWDKKEE